MSNASRQLERLREHRARPGRDVSIAADVARTAVETSRVHKKLGQFIELWERFVPPDLAAQTSVVSLRGGNVQVQAESAAAAFELDRLLRTGLLVQLRASFPAPLARVKVKVGG